MSQKSKYLGFFLRDVSFLVVKARKYFLAQRRCSSSSLKEPKILGGLNVKKAAVFFRLSDSPSSLVNEPLLLPPAVPSQTSIPSPLATSSPKTRPNTSARTSPSPPRPLPPPLMTPNQSTNPLSRSPL
ncbi:unnamed protein product [Prunus armeniaca]|uniref:Uncharacterized protein n=1 Tax=Prunus armeniaca TaxID=36596 RepID=A0A6J5WXK0_PRUAR|nr:unnamed protein product [Prunus armeniaca]